MVLLAVRGNDRVTLAATSRLKLVNGFNRVNENGANWWNFTSKEPHRHSFLAYDTDRDGARAAMTNEIDSLLCQPPKLEPPEGYRDAFAELNSPMPPPPPPLPPMVPGQKVVEEQDCGVCWHVNDGEPGDCSSIPGCGSWGCDFCTNDDRSVLGRPAPVKHDDDDD